MSSTWKRSLVALVAFLAACGGPGISERPGPDAIGDLKPKVDLELSTVQGFVLGEGSVGSPLRSGIDTPRAINPLFALGAGGELTPVRVSTSDEESVLGVHDTQKYVVLETEGVKWHGKLCGIVLLRKSDGALFCVEARLSSFPYSNQPLSPNVQSDISGDRLFLLAETTEGGIYGTVVRLDLADPANPTQTNLTPQTGEYGVYRMMVNGDGDVLTMFGGDSLRLIRADGQTQNLSGRPNGCHTTGLQGDGTGFYYWGFDAQGREGIHHLAKQADGSFASSVYATTALQQPSGCIFLMRGADQLLVTSVVPGGSFVSMVNPQGSPAGQSAASGSFTQRLPESDGFLLAGTDQILRYRASSGTTATLLPSGSYRVGQVAVSPSGAVTFAGVRLSDGGRVVGSIAPGQVSVSEVQEGAPEVRQIVRIR